MPSINFTINTIEFDFNIVDNEEEWYCETKHKNYTIIISAKKEIFEKDNTIQKLKNFCDAISVNFEKILQKTMLWTKNLYNELGSFEEEKGYFDNKVFFNLIEIEYNCYFNFDVNICFFSKIGCVMDLNHFYNVQFKSMDNEVFLKGIYIE